MKNKINGFTLVELLVTMVILGIITSLSFPMLTHYLHSNEMRKYEYYANILKDRAKLYYDSYEDDIMGDRSSDGCGVIRADMLEKKKFFTDIDDNNMTCKSNFTFVKVVKTNGKISYTVYLGCGEKDDVNANGYIVNSSKVQIVYPDKSSSPYNSSNACS